MDSNKTLFRCSQLGSLMTESKTKSETISATTKAYLREVFINKKYGRWKNFESKFTQKGLMVEELGLDLYTLISKKVFNKNEERILNDYIIGTPDTFEGKNIHEATRIIDIKSSWDLFTFYDAKFEKLSKNYYWQLQGYMWLTGAQSSTLAYCLINTPDVLVQDQKRRLGWKMGLIDDYTSQEFLDAAAKIDKNSLFDDIPREERLHEIHVQRCDEAIEQLRLKVIECRNWMNQNLK